MIFWLNMLLVVVLLVLMILGQWDFVLAGLLVLLVLNGVLAR